MYKYFRRFTVLTKKIDWHYEKQISAKEVGEDGRWRIPRNFA